MLNKKTKDNTYDLLCDILHEDVIVEDLLDEIEEEILEKYENKEKLEYEITPDLTLNSQSHVLKFSSEDLEVDTVCYKCCGVGSLYPDFGYCDVCKGSGSMLDWDDLC